MIKLKRVAITPPTGFEPKPKKYEEETPLYEDEGKLPKDVKTTLSKMLEDIASIDKMLSNVEKTFSPSNTLQHLDKTIQGLLNKKTEILNEEMSAQLGRDYKEAKQSIQEQLNNIVSVMREHQTNALQVKDKLVALSRVKVRSPQLNISDVTAAAKTLDLTKDQIEYLLKEGKKVVEKDVAEIILSSEASLNKEAGVFSWIAKAFNKVVDKLSSFYNDLKAELAGWDKIDQLLGSTTVEATKNKADKLTVWEYENAADYNQTQDADLLSEEDLMPPEEEISPKAEEGLAELEQNASKKEAFQIDWPYYTLNEKGQLVAEDGVIDFPEQTFNSPTDAEQWLQDNDERGNVVEASKKKAEFISPADVRVGKTYTTNEGDKVKILSKERDIVDNSKYDMPNSEGDSYSIEVELEDGSKDSWYLSKEDEIFMKTSSKKKADKDVHIGDKIDVFIYYIDKYEPATVIEEPKVTDGYTEIIVQLENGDQVTAIYNNPSGKWLMSEGGYEHYSSKQASKKIATTNFEKFKQCYINDLKESHSEEEFPDLFSTIKKTENYNDFVTILSENGMTAKDIERVVEDFMTKEAAKKKAGYSLGQEVTVHPHLTTDPYDKRGERGIIKEFEDDEVAVVEFEDGTIGKYMLYALIASKKVAEVAHETNLKEGQQVYFNNKKQRVIWTRGNSVMLSDEQQPVHITKLQDTNRQPIVNASKKVAHDHKVGDWVTLSGTDSEGVSVYIPGARIEDFNPTNPDGTGEYKIEGTWYDENEYYVESIQSPTRSSIIVGDTIVTTEEIFDPLIGSFHKGFQDVVVEVQDSGYVRTSALGWVGTNKLEKVAGRMIEDIDSFDIGDEVTYKKRSAKVIKASLDTLSIKFTDGQVRNVPIGDVKKVATELAEDIPVDIVDSATNFARRQYQANVAEAEVIEGLMSQYNLTESQAYVIVEDLGFNEPYGVKNSSSHLLSKEDMQSFASEDKIPVEDVAWVDDPTNESETEEDSSLPKLPHMATKKFKDEEEYQEYFEGSKPLVREDILHEIKNNKSRTEIVDFILNFYDLKPEDVERMVDRSLRRNRHEENDTVGNTGIKASKKTSSGLDKLKEGLRQYVHIIQQRDKDPQEFATELAAVTTFQGLRAFAERWQLADQLDEVVGKTLGASKKQSAVPKPKPGDPINFDGKSGQVVSVDETDPNNVKFEVSTPDNMTWEVTQQDLTTQGQ